MSYKNFYFISRIKCCQLSQTKHENGRINSFYTQETLQMHGQSNVYNEMSQDIPVSPDVSAEYAVVMKPKKEKTSSRPEKESDKTFHNVSYDEYDITGNFRSGTSNPSTNLYNHLENDNYNTASIPIRQDNNLYDTTTRGDLVDSVYDTTRSVNGRASHDDVYNHLS